MSIHIANATQLQNMQADPTADYILDNDIDLAGVDWDPIGYGSAESATTFIGTFDGQGFTIRNLTVNQNNNHTFSNNMIGLFGVIGRKDLSNNIINKATISNLILEDVTLYAKVGSQDAGSIAALAGRVFGADISGVTVNNVTVIVQDDLAYNVGGLIGFIDLYTGMTNSVVDCQVNNFVGGGNGEVGGLIGGTNNNASALSIENCSAVNSIITTTGFGPYDIGGLAGSLAAIQLTNCYSTGVINSSESLVDVGGFSGYVNDCDFVGICYADVEINLTYNDSLGYVGGFCSELVNCTLDKCYSLGTINVPNARVSVFAVAGFVAFASDCFITNCYSRVEINITDSDGGDNLACAEIAGFVGYIENDVENSYLKNSYASGNINITAAGTFTYESLGGFAGEVHRALVPTNSIINCFSVGIINATEDLDTLSMGGFIGVINGSGAPQPTITNCAWFTGAFAYAVGSYFSGTTATLTELGYGTDEVDNTTFYEKTHVVFDQLGSYPWNFDTPIWYERLECTDYPTFEACPAAVEACSANPIWCMRDLMTNKRYGLGNYMTEADFDAAQMISDAAYCDELVDDGNGGQEVRHRLDVVIDSRVKAMDLISQLSASFRGLPFYSAGKVNLKIDRPQAFPTQLFGMGNIIKDSFSQKWKSDKERFNMIEVQFLDKEKDYQQETVVVIDEEAFEVNNEDQKPHQLRLFVTRMSEAIREGRYALKVSKYIEKIVNFKTQINALVVQPGDRIDLSHDVPQVGFSGTIKSGSTTTSIKIDREVTISPSITYKLKIIFSDDTIEECEVTNAPGTYTTLTVTPAFSQAPAAFDKYVFGRENILTEPFRVISIERSNADEITIGALQYKSDVYADDVLILPETKYSQLDTGFPVVTNLKLNELILKNEDGIISNSIQVTFNKPSTSNNPINSYAFARIYISDNNGSTWTLVGETMNELFEIVDTGLVPGVTYKVAVNAVNGRGIEGNIANAAMASILIHTSLVATIDLWSKNREYKLASVGVVQGNLYDPTYTRDVFAIETANNWNDIIGQDWDGFDLDNQTVAASGTIEETESIDLGIRSKYTFSPVFLFKNNSGGSAKVQISKSDDNITFDAYADIVPSTEYQTQYVKFKYFIETSDTAEQVLLYGATIGVDSPRVLTI